MSHINALPTDGMSYSPLEEKYWDPAKLQPELDRAYDICNGCRLCFNLCPSFPALFDFLDHHENDVRKITTKESDYVVDTCFQCKVCYVKCPYTPTDGHDFQLDFPALLQRAKAVRAKSKGIALREKMLGSPDFLGKMVGPVAGLVNFAHRIPPVRWVMQLFMGLHRHKLMPKFHRQTFIKWFRKNEKRLNLNGDNGKVFYFPTCFGNYNAPDIGKAAMEVFAKNGLTVVSDYQQCCGMPALDGGDVAKAQRMAQENIAHLLPWVEKGYTVLALNPTCSMMMRHEYPKLVEGDAAKQVAEAVRDPMEYLNLLRKDGKFNENFKSSPGTVNYHVPCHLRAQNIGYRSRDIMRKIEGTEIGLVTECSGHDGTWAMKKEYFKFSLKYGKKAFDGLTQNDPNLTATDCPLAAVQFEQATGRKALHPLQVLEKAYREDGFSTPIAHKAE